MRKLLFVFVFALALATTLAIAQDQDQDNSAKQDMQQAGQATKKAAKKVGHGTKKAAEATGHGIKKGAVATKDKVTGGDDAAADRAERQQSVEDRAETNAQERRDERRDEVNNQNTLPQGEGQETRRDEQLERSVHIVRGPDVDAGDRSATIRWQTNKVAATDVWLMGGGIRGHRTRYEPGGSDSHSVTFTGLRPHTTYTYEIRTREGGDRKQGSFTTR